METPGKQNECPSLQARVEEAGDNLHLTFLREDLQPNDRYSTRRLGKLYLYPKQAVAARTGSDSPRGQLSSAIKIPFNSH